MTTEPPNEYKKDADYNQFGLLVTPFKDRYKQHPNIMCSNTYLSWLWYFAEDFVKEYAWFENTPARISLIISDEATLNNQVKRIAFAYHLKKKLGSQIDIYGRGFRPIKQKQEAFENYDYTVVMENSVHSDHWTEKIAHAYYTKCFPFYVGCTNLEKYFPKESFVTLDINNPNEAVRIMRNALDNNLHEKNKEYVLNAREKLMKEYTLDKGLIKIAKYILQQEKDLSPITVTQKCETVLQSKPYTYFFKQSFLLLRRKLYKIFYIETLQKILRQENQTLSAPRR